MPTLRTPVSKPDFVQLAYNVRCMRMAHNLTQAELAERAGVDVATVHRLETGKRLHRRSLEKICEGLNESVSFLSSVLPYGTPGSGRAMFLHRSGDLNWFGYDDRRKRIPEDSQQRLQDEAERLRLGRAGLMSWFQAYVFTMPKGPSMSMAELYEPVQWGPSRAYEDCITYCARGEISISIRGEVIVLKAGDGLGYKSAEVTMVGPTKPIGPTDLPPVVWHITANRTGHVPIEFLQSPRLRTRHGKRRG